MGRTTRLLVCVLTLSTAVAVSAQEKRATEPTPAEWRAKIQADKKGIVERAMKLTPEQAKKFWPLYDSFQQELEKPRREYSRAVIDYVSAGDALNDATAKRLAEQAGFRLVASSEINANPKDTTDWPEGVWTLPPVLRLKDVDREKYLAVGESDRMTLKFVKPR
jgi:Spy/CpxP family protein refolding chaperone